MSESTSAVLEAPVTKSPVESDSFVKPAKPRKVKPSKTPKAKASPKKVPAKAKPAKAASKKSVDRAMSDVPAKERRVNLVKVLRKMGAVDKESARPISVLAQKLGYTAYDVYCLTYHKFPLAKQGFVKVTEQEGHRDQCVYLTAKGQSTLPE